ncbi:uncharacterized protein K452DRAFT_200078, partial [Aplosporella prunicola CBS 121167]
YAFRVPTPPRIIIPPPAHNMESVANLQVTNVSTIDRNGPDVSFLALINQGLLESQNAGLEWTYEKRREAQFVTPYIYLGPHSAAKDREFLVNTGITMLLGIRHGATPVNAARRIAQELDITFTTVDVLNPQELVHSFPASTSIINAHLSKVQSRIQSGQGSGAEHGKVLVFCESGNEKSAAVVVAWMMEMLNLDFLRAMQFCQTQRFCVNFDDNLKLILQSYGDILDAKRQVASSRRELTTGLSQSGSKRSLDLTPVEDMDVDATTDDDMARFEGRDYAPFQDV